MKRALLMVGVLTGCGPAAAPGDGFDVQLAVSRGLLDQISGFQVALVKQGASLDCVTVQRACLKDQVGADRLVPVKDSAGVTHQALRFPISLQTGTPNTQDVSLRDLPLGRDFALVVEALSKDAPPRLAGSSCNYVKELTAGTNATVFARVELLTTPASCDPSLP
ncbi:MAG: hypothetical protein AMXMBFR34_37160 [Myxococcaceae bacterium]